ncbi:MAG: NUDIX hydrolase [Stackebrandtia sp.]
MRTRRSARVVLFDTDERLLLCKVKDATVRAPGDPIPEIFWATIGGALEEGEDYVDAACRETFEETGIDDVDLGPWIWERELRLDWRGELVRSYERYFFARTRAADVVFDHLGAAERDVFQGYRWWSLEELRAAAEVETFRPPELLELVQSVIVDGCPPMPLRIA